MRVAVAQLPAMRDSTDKVFTTDNAVIMLDATTADVPAAVPADAYADRLGRALRDALNAAPDDDLHDILADAIGRTATDLRLTPGQSPSSAVSIVRETDDRLDVLVLGGNTVVLPDEVITDDRLTALDLAADRTYRERLAAGAGYDDEHRALLAELHTQQAERRNRDDGFWIAEADPGAAEHAVHSSRSLVDARWAVLATTGAYETLYHLGLDDWRNLLEADPTELNTLLHDCETWEAHADPDAAELPRAERHADKSIAVVSFAR
ncbi:hypothetical protein B0I33_105153 [Prauserella shujinwangii]|uniref:Protein phosphatase 2C-like protein n=1 Tax=Prauserella shujinwangii TaxID=1453103 RepID=A0A2T0LUR8_9PSEU|nr:hypothetical protein [Prauserella shujinwangii]PRX47574.1 hypothetical protein B0I33_105153 [Prauserella shujinwangii]